MKNDANVRQRVRGSFVHRPWTILRGAAIVEFGAVAFAFWRPSPIRTAAKGGKSIITAGAVERFEPNTVTAFVRGKFYLVRLEDGGFLALSRTCNHLGCTLPWSEKEMKFPCPCHGSAFAITGKVLDAPAPRALDIYPINIENNIIKVDVRNPIKRRDFHSEQITYPPKKV